MILLALHQVFCLDLEVSEKGSSELLIYMHCKDFSWKVHWKLFLPKNVLEMKFIMKLHEKKFY